MKNLTFKRFLSLTALAFVLVGVKVQADTAATAAAVPAAPAGNAVLDPTAMDTSVSPCQDFYQYSCGNWLKRTEIPSDQSRWDRSFSTVEEQNWATLKDVLTDYSGGNYSLSTPYEEKLGDYYGSCMDEGTIEKNSAAVVEAQLKQIDHLKSKKQLPQFIGRLHLEGINVLFSFGPAADLKNPDVYIGEADQGGLGLPDSTYYKRTDADTTQVRGQYKDHIAKMFELVGESESQAKSEAADVFTLENTLAGSALGPEDLQDPTKVYHPYDVLALQAQTPNFDWTQYFHALKIKAPAKIDVTEPKFMAAVNSVLVSTDIAKIRTYLKYHVIEAVAPFLGANLHAEEFHFEDTILNGQQEMDARWKFCVKSVSGGMSEALGQAFVAKNFSPQAKQRALDMITHLRQAFENDLQTVVWLDAPTRAAALAKLNLFGEKIGYPDKWRNYDALSITRNSFWRNGLSSQIFESHREMNKIGGAVDPKEWDMSPQTVNAYYDPNRNQINFPAGILQPPFFSENAPDASNFGAIGMVIGHEMTHGFDTTGSKFDGHGLEKDWWTPGVKAQFDQKAQCLINQYSRYSPLAGLNVNGNLTKTENIADSGGLKLSYAAFTMAKAGRAPAPEVAGLNEDQQYFVSMAQMWCGKQRDESVRKQVSGDPHSPDKFRVIGTLVNFPPFADAFGCQAGSPMDPVNRCTIW